MSKESMREPLNPRKRRPQNEQKREQTNKSNQLPSRRDYHTSKRVRTRDSEDRYQRVSGRERQRQQQSKRRTQQPQREPEKQGFWSNPRNAILTILQWVFGAAFVVIGLYIAMFMWKAHNVRNMHGEGDMVGEDFYAQYQAAQERGEFLETSEFFGGEGRALPSNTQGLVRITNPVTGEVEWIDPEAVMADATYLGKIKIPKIEVDENIYLGTSNAILTYGVGLIEGTDLPDNRMGTSTVIAGHRGYTGVSQFFQRADELDPGDTIEIYTRDKKLVYNVTQTIIVEPTDIDAVRQLPNENLLTLVTCTPMYDWSDRMLVEAKLVNWEYLHE